MTHQLAGLLAAVQARIEAFTGHGDASGILAAAALEEADRLRTLAQEQPAAVELQIIYAPAWLHWCSYLSLPEGARPAKIQSMWLPSDPA